MDTTTTTTTNINNNDVDSNNNTTTTVQQPIQQQQHPIQLPIQPIQLPKNNKEYGTLEYWEQRFQYEQSFEWLVSYIQIKHQIEPILLQYCYCNCNNNSNNDHTTTINNTNNDTTTTTTTTTDSTTSSSSSLSSTTTTTTSTYIDKSLVQILIIGCGNSSLSQDLYDDGYTSITNIDYSITVIEYMKSLHTTKRPLMKWYTMDMIHIQYTDTTTNTDNNSNDNDTDTTTIDTIERNTFHVVIDKAAMDAIMTHEGDVWHPNPIVIQNVYQMLYHISYHILIKKNNNSNTNTNTNTTTNHCSGTYIQISLSQPHFRKKYLLHLHPDDTTTIIEHPVESVETKVESETEIIEFELIDDNNTTTTTTKDNTDNNNNCSVDVDEDDDPNYCPYYNWTVQSEIAGDITTNSGSFGHYLYIMQKR